MNSERISCTPSRSVLVGYPKPGRRTWKGIGLLLAPAAVALAAGPVHLEKTVDTTPNLRISISNLSGQVVVRGWEKSQIHATWTSPSTNVEVDTEVMPDTGPAEKVHFTTHALNPLAIGNDQTTDYTLEVPTGASLEIRNRQGGVRVEKLQGDTWVESVGGTISASDVAGHLAVRSVGGDIEIVRSSGRVEVSSITGNLHFVAPLSSKLHATTTSGRILYEGDFASGGDYTLSTYSGNMEILCPPAASFELNAKTVKGKLDNTLPIVPKRHSPGQFSSASSLLGTNNTGNATVGLTSFTGTIRIHPQYY
jgi:hypothetical protein